MTDEEEDPVLGFKTDPKFERYRVAVPLEVHVGVQLTFEYGQTPLKVVANVISGFQLFHKELKVITESGQL